MNYSSFAVLSTFITDSIWFVLIMVLLTQLFKKIIHLKALYVRRGNITILLHWMNEAQELKELDKSTENRKVNNLFNMCS